MTSGWMYRSKRLTPTDTLALLITLTFRLVFGWIVVSVNEWLINAVSPIQHDA